jgi:hypothetical protein
MLDVNVTNNYEEIDKSKAFQKLQLVETKIATFKLSRTGGVWIQLLNMIRILKTFTKAERTGNWEQHLQTTMKMFPFFAAAGHSNYLKSNYFYVQNIMSLKETKPLLYHVFQSGHHVIRRGGRRSGPSPSGPYLSGTAGVIQARGLIVRFTSGPWRFEY